LERRALSGTDRLGTHRTIGEVDPDALESALETIEESRGPLLALAEPPADAVKFLNKREVTALEHLVDAGKEANALPLSMLRAEVFGAHQARLTQASRQAGGGNTIRALIEGGPEEDYPAQTNRWRGIESHLGRCRLAALHVLLRGGHPAVATALLDLAPDIDFAALAPRLAAANDSSNVVSLRSGQATQALAQALDDEAIAGPGLAALGQQARQAHKSLARQGFRDDDIANETIVEGFAAGLAGLKDLTGGLNRYLSILEDRLNSEDEADLFSREAGKFSTAFHSLYGGDE
jgi:hypothetical protein